MTLSDHELSGKYRLNFKLFLELMVYKVREILLVSSPYDAFLIEEDVTLASRIINEYSGLNLSQPPRVTRTSSALQALRFLDENRFDLVITMPHLEDMDAFSLGRKIKEKAPGLPVYLLAHSMSDTTKSSEVNSFKNIDRVFIWSGNTDLLLAIIKSAEDKRNADYDTSHGQVRVLMYVEDSPFYYSSILPILYMEVVHQIQAVLELGVNEEERLLIMRTRPKILFARTYEEAFDLFLKYKPYLMGIISDARFPRHGKQDNKAGADFLSMARKEIPYLPILLMSSEPGNRSGAEAISVEFIDKNSNGLHGEIHKFFLNHLGFGDFVFRMSDGREVARASKLRTLEEKLSEIPEESLRFHVERKHLSNWVMMRSEFELATTIQEITNNSFDSAEAMRQYIISLIHLVRKWRQKGVVTRFNRKEFNAEFLDFTKIGKGSIGGKARGLAFMSSVLNDDISFHRRYPSISIKIPQTIVLSTDVFQAFVDINLLKRFAADSFSDEEVRKAFLEAKFPDDIVGDLKVYLKHITYPLSVRSSSLLEDAQFKPYAGLYETYMLPNNDPSLEIRLDKLLSAVKMVYASTYYESPKVFAKRTAGRPQEEAMAVIIQELAGDVYGDYYYPAVSGVAQSHNFYPVSGMRPEEGVVQMALGFGKTVVEGEKSLRFSPMYPELLLQFSTIDDILNNAQRFFYSLKVSNISPDIKPGESSGLEKRDIYDARDELPVRMMTSTYDPEEHRIYDTGEGQGGKIITFHPILKHRVIPLPELLSDLLEITRKKMGCPVEMEFAMNFLKDKPGLYEFYLLQVRPMVANEELFEVEISPGDKQKSFCFSNLALGNGKIQDIADIVFVKPENFKLEETVKITEEIGSINGELVRNHRPYLLIGPGRWGSLDRWLGIPVHWKHISGVRTIIELRSSLLNADPSQGSHFFQKITSLGIPYVTVTEGTDDFLYWGLLHSIPLVQETTFVKHVKLDRTIIIKTNGRTSQCVMYIQ